MSSIANGSFFFVYFFSTFNLETSEKKTWKASILGITPILDNSARQVLDVVLQLSVSAAFHATCPPAPETTVLLLPIIMMSVFFAWLTLTLSLFGIITVFHQPDAIVEDCKQLNQYCF